MDGFDQTVNVKVIMATNRADTLDPALLRPGRLDRKIEFPLPDRRQKRLVFQASLFGYFIFFSFLLWQYSCLLNVLYYRWEISFCLAVSWKFLFIYFQLFANHIIWWFHQVCTAKMNLSDEVDLEDYVSRPDKISAAEVCTCRIIFVPIFM